jgi:ribose-phosphate pyrophosphokinase
MAVYLVQPTCQPVNDNLMELLLTVGALRRASASRVTAVIPYYGYARQDRKDRPRVTISAADVARMIESMGVDRVVCVDLHCGQIQGFFGPRTPVDNLYAGPIALQYFKYKNLLNPVVVSPDAGGVYRAKTFKEGLEGLGIDTGLAMIIKQRKAAGVIGTMDLVGHVKGCDCIIVDDMIDTAGTLTTAANELQMMGARKVYAFATHGLFNGPAFERIEASALEEVVCANTIPLREGTLAITRKIKQLSIGKLLAETIQRLHTGDSVSSIFDDSANLFASAPVNQSAHQIYPTG